MTLKRRSRKNLSFNLKPIALAIAVVLGSSINVQAQNTCSTVVINTNDSPPPAIAGSLRAAVECANSDPNQDTITFNLPTNSIITLAPSDANFDSQLIVEQNNLTITGPVAGDPAGIVINANGSRIFHSTVSLTLDNLTLKNGKTSAASGAGIYISPTNSAIIPLTLTLNHSLLTENATKAGNGGGIFASNTLVVINNSTVSNNVADGNTGAGNGGGIHSGYKVTLTNSTVSGNSTTGDNSKGGGIFAFADVSLTNSHVTGNSTVGSNSGGGGISSEYIVTLNNSTVSGNTTSGLRSPGGGIRSRKEAIITLSMISGNSTSGEESPGGGIYEQNAFVDISQSTISGNSTTGNHSPGGGIHIYIDTGNSVIKQSTISGNTTAGDGSSGGGFNSERGGVNIYNSTFSLNSTKGGGFLVTGQYGTYTIPTNGGGINATALLLRQSTVSGNEVLNGSSSGGGIHIEGVKKSDNQPGFNEGPTEIIQSTITDNSHISDGTAGVSIRAIQSNTIINNSIISGNNGLSNLSFINPFGSDPNTISFTNSLIGDSEGDFTSDIGSQTGMTGNFNITDPKLAVLTDNGGTTLTHLPLAGSPAIDTGTGNGASPLDQRLEPRVVGIIDIGSVELSVTTPPIIPAAVCVPK